MIKQNMEVWVTEDGKVFPIDEESKAHSHEVECIMGSKLQGYLAGKVQSGDLPQIVYALTTYHEEIGKILHEYKVQAASPNFDSGIRQLVTRTFEDPAVRVLVVDFILTKIEDIVAEWNRR